MQQTTTLHHPATKLPLAAHKKEEARLHT